jgi:hypothetical protein
MTRILTSLAFLLALQNAIFFSSNQKPVTSIALVQKNQISYGGSGVTSGTATFTSNNVSGNFIAVPIRSGNYVGSTFAVTDSQGNTYHETPNCGSDSVEDNGVCIFYAMNIAAGANTVTVTQTNTTSLSIVILEYSGIATSSALDVSAGANGASTAPNSGNATTTVNGDLLIGDIASNVNQTFSAGPGYTIEEVVNTSFPRMAVEDQVQSAAGVSNASMTLSTSDDWAAAFAAFKP